MCQPSRRRLLAVACKRLFGPTGLGPWKMVPDPFACLAYACLLNHFVRQNQERLGKRDPEGLGGLQVENELERGGLLHR